MVTSEKHPTWLILVCTDMYWFIMMIQLRKPDILWYGMDQYEISTFPMYWYMLAPYSQVWRIPESVWRSIGIEWYGAVWSGMEMYGLSEHWLSMYQYTGRGICSSCCLITPDIKHNHCQWHVNLLVSRTLPWHRDWQRECTMPR
jgi:hypothetical protein